jgi:hypothetical protein
VVGEKGCDGESWVGGNSGVEEKRARLSLVVVGKGLGKGEWREWCVGVWGEKRARLSLVVGMPCEGGRGGEMKGSVEGKTGVWGEERVRLSLVMGMEVKRGCVGVWGEKGGGGSGLGKGKCGWERV